VSTTNAPKVSDDNRSIAKTAAQVFSGSPSVCEYQDDKGVSAIDLLSCPDSPTAGVTSYSTIGLSDHQFKAIDTDMPLGVEVVGACGSNFELYPNIISSISFAVVNDKQECYPDAVFKHVVTINEASETLKHVLLVDPFLWSAKLETLRFTQKATAWLQAVPISDGELNYLEKNGADALHELFTKHQIDVFNLNRVSVAS